MITVKNLKKSFDDKIIFNGFDLSLPDKGTYYISGPSGSGKTTLLRIIAGLDTDYEGTVEHDGVISYVFQENRLIPSLTAYQNVFEVCRDKEKTTYLLKEVGLEADSDKYPAELSGGMNRRVAIARALAFDHDILLLDEPFTALDGEIKKSVISLIKEREADRLILLVSHDESEADALSCERIKFR
ncbi:MAG: ABC transporter ATP-binding protein [Clostridia bacterium]|nr:ABC transporter ATP-binding protein [Clostridia bacterium]